MGVTRVLGTFISVTLRSGLYYVFKEFSSLEGQCLVVKRIKLWGEVLGQWALFTGEGELTCAGKRCRGVLLG